MNRTQSQQLYPQDAMPKKLLNTNNFQFKLNQVYSQIIHINQSSILEGSKIPTIPGYQNNNLETSKSQGNLHINTQQNQYNTSINQSIFHNQQPFSNQFNQRDSLQNPRSTTNNQSLFQSYDFSVKHFGLLCDRTYLDHSKAFKSQKFGQRRNPIGVKLEPIEDQETHNINLNKHSKVVSKQKSLIPYANLEDWDMRMFIKKVLNHNGYRVVMSLNSIEIIAKEQDNMTRSQEINQTVHKRHKKRILNHMLNFTILKYLLQYNYCEILEVFKQCMQIVSYQEGDEDNIIDIPKLEFDFEKFEQLPKFNPNNPYLQNESYPAFIEIPCKDNEKIMYIVKFPTIEIYISDINYKKVITLSRQQLLDLIQNDYSNLDDYLNHIEENKVQILKKTTYSSHQLEEELADNKQAKGLKAPISKSNIKIPSISLLEQNTANKNELVVNLSRITLTQLEERKPLNFEIQNSKVEKSQYEIMNQKYFKELVNQEEFIIISFFPSKVTLKQQNVEYSQQITHNLSFSEFYELIALTSSYDMLNYVLNKVRFSGQRKSSSQPNTDDEGDSSSRKRPSFLKRIDLQLPKCKYDAKDYVVLNQENETNGLLRENTGYVTLDDKKYLLKISPPIFEVNYSLENRREIQQLTIQQLNDIVKRGFNFSFKVIPH